MINIFKNGTITNTGPDNEWLQKHITLGSFGAPETYTVEFFDDTAQKEQEQVNAEALAYLAQTDWVVTRAMERGEPLTEEFKSEREAARARIV